MVKGAEISTQIPVSNSDTIELRHGQSRNIDSEINDFSAGQVTHQSVNEQIKLASESIFWQIEKLCGLLADRTD